MFYIKKMPLLSQFLEGNTEIFFSEWMIMFCKAYRWFSFALSLYAFKKVKFSVHLNSMLRYSLLNLFPMPVAFFFFRLWSCFLKATVFQMNRRSKTKKIGVDHCARKLNVNVLLILIVWWEKNLAAVEAINKYYGYL